MDFRFDRESPAITLLAQSRITDGERLRVNYYHGTLIYHDQVGACMSEPKVLFGENVDVVGAEADIPAATTETIPSGPHQTGSLISPCY